MLNFAIFFALEKHQNVQFLLFSLLHALKSFRKRIFRREEEKLIKIKTLRIFFSKWMI